MTRINLIDPSYTAEEILNALELNDFYISTTAKYLSIPRTRMYAYIQKYQIGFDHKSGVQAKHKIINDVVNNVYYKMINRCNNPEASDYKYYGARGIKVHKEWAENRDSFSEYVINLPNFGEKGYSIDRIDNNGNYEPGNIKYSTKKEQSNNKRNNRVVTYNGIDMTLSEFCDTYCKVLGMSFNYVRDRLNLGFTLQEVLELPKNKKRKSYFKKESNNDQN
jgi:hypothetical protein